MTRIDLIRCGSPHGFWFSPDDMIRDLLSKQMELKPGDRLLVTAWNREPDARPPGKLRLVETT